MSTAHIPEIWEWAEYYCPWCYVGAVRLHGIMPDYKDRVRMRIRPSGSFSIRMMIATVPTS